MYTVGVCTLGVCTVYVCVCVYCMCVYCIYTLCVYTVGVCTEGVCTVCSIDVHNTCTMVYTAYLIRTHAHGIMLSLTSGSSRAQSLAGEIEELRKRLSDYNIVSCVCRYIHASAFRLFCKL